MTDDLLGITPPDNTGSDVLRRYRYQAHIAFPYCLSCCLENDITSVFLEHFEDVLIQYEDSWHMMQIKTRNPDRGPWKLSNTIGSNGGIRGLARSYKILKAHNVTFGLYLEGAIAKGDKLNGLVPTNKNITDELVEVFADKLDLTRDESKVFLDRLSVHPNNPHRNIIASRNIQILGRLAPQVSHGELTAVYNNFIDVIFRAMEGSPLGERIGEIFLIGEGKGNLLELEVQMKIFTKERLLEVLGDVTKGPYPLLKRITNLQKGSPTNLEAKLMAGGAEENVINDAKTLRANASFRIAELSSLNLFGDNKQIEDVRLRLITLSNSVIQNCLNDTTPARKAWGEILHRLEANSVHVDSNQLFRQDPYLLLGIICELTDECQITWGVPIA